VIDTSHLQVATAGGDQAHLLRVVTPTDRLDVAIDADVLLADGTPLIMTWRRDAADAVTVELAIALVLDSRPQHLELRWRSEIGTPPAFLAVGDVSTNATLLVTSPQRVLLEFAEEVDPLADVLLGAVDTSIARIVAPWLIDISNLGVGETFEIILRAGPPGDVDDDDDVDLADFEALLACLEGADSDGECELFFDFNADESVDLSDFAVFQRAFTHQPPAPPRRRFNHEPTI
jgi:hypothetical protein